MAVAPQKYNCCGCAACENICSQQAITMQSDSIGFKYPVVDYNKCIECGACEHICQFNEKYNRYTNFEVPKAFLMRLKDKEELSRSQSGGAFYALATYFITKGGIVFGAAFDDQWNVKHIKVETAVDLERLRMSKYVQSSINDVFRIIRSLLKNGKEVMFSGTPCQVAALKSYIPTSLHKNLFCVDIICHGVPSPKIWNDYVAYIESKYKSKIVKACFRDKRFGWHGAVESFMLDNGREVFRKTSNTLYFRNLSVRDSCSNCPYTNTKRVGDITVGDFWGLPKESSYEDGLGTSLMLINSDTGMEYLRCISDVALIEEKNIEECLQPQLKGPITLNVERNNFIKDYNSRGFKYIAKKYSDIGVQYKINLYYTLLKNKVKHFMAK